MTIALGDNQYGKAETRLVTVRRTDREHHITDLNVTTTLAGDLEAVHVTGDNSGILPTDSQKNTVFAFAREGVREIEDFGQRLARHFVANSAAIRRARVHIEQYGWQRVSVDSADLPHSFVRSSGTRTATVTFDGVRTAVVSGVTDLVALNSAGSEFWGYQKDRYTTLPETKDRILATAVDASWRHSTVDSVDWGRSYAETLRHLLEAFATTHSRSLQQTLYTMGERVLRHRVEVAEVRLSLPNRHHILVDLTPFGLDNPNEVFAVPDRPYGLIEGTVLRENAPDPGPAWW